ncbi:MAG TPA: alcohol dehydrogenase catalytic domain-containing protein [Candidatus Sulfotelmatobacter sp.]|nr:alcohol dehydrogenase catalytic domain-containing protein [Candidatus Sulfotelmatobacter sp.]
MKAMKFPEPGRAEIVDLPVPVPTAGEVLVRVRAAGICASDVAAFTGKHDVRRPPVITGHELAGEIVQLGAGVTGHGLGDRVAIEPHLGCGTCALCRQGHYHECPSKRFLGVGDWVGAFAEYAVAAEPMLHRMPDKMSWEEGAALEPLCVGLHAVRRAGLRMGERVALLGAGTIGLMTLLAMNQAAPGWIAVTDPSRIKREMAVRCGADLVLDPTVGDPVEAVRRATDGLGADVVFLAVAAEPALRQAVEVCRRMGRLVVIASFFHGGLLPVHPLQVRERTLIGTSMYTADDYRLAIRLWERGQLAHLSALLTDRISLSDAPAMVAALAKGERPDAIKVIIDFA